MASPAASLHGDKAENDVPMTRREWPALAPARPFDPSLGWLSEVAIRPRAPNNHCLIAAALDGVPSNGESARPRGEGADGESAGS
jgi:hypothetical protein